MTQRLSYETRTSLLLLAGTAVAVCLAIGADSAMAFRGGFGGGFHGGGGFGGFHAGGFGGFHGGCRVAPWTENSVGTGRCCRLE